jgi:glucokinase
VSELPELPALALDIGGTKIAAGIVDPAGRLVASQRIDTPRGVELGAEHLFSHLDALVSRVAGDTSFSGVGVGVGGPMSWPAGVVSTLNIPAWRDFPLRERLAERFAGLPVRVHNDAVCLAVAEHWRGAGRGKSDMLGLVVSTGVGGGLVLGGSADRRRERQRRSHRARGGRRVRSRLRVRRRRMSRVDRARTGHRGVGSRERLAVPVRHGARRRRRRRPRPPGRPARRWSVPAAR